MSATTRLFASVVACSFALPGNSRQMPAGDTIPVPFNLRMCKMPPGYIRGLLELSSATSISRNTKSKLLDITGELGYQYFDRNGSLDDLRLLQTTSHVLWGRMQVVYKERYPFAVQFRINHTQPFQLDNPYELGLGFDKEAYRRLLYERAKKQIQRETQSRYSDLRQEYIRAFKQYQKTRQQVSGLAYTYRVAEERIRQRTMQENLQAGLSMPDMQLPGAGQLQLPSIDTTGWRDMLKDSVMQLAGIPALREQLLSDPLQLDSMKQVIASLEKKIADLKTDQSRQLDSLGKALANRKLPDLDRKKLKKGVSSDSTELDELPRPFWTKFSVRLGKYLVQTSELTVSNIFLHGAGVRYGDRTFVEVTAGVYDFAFNRLLSFRPDTQMRHRPYLIAMRVGRENGGSLDAFTFYYGTRRNLTGTISAPAFKTIAGISVEKRIEWSPYLRLAVELAKSTPRALLAADEEGKSVKELFTRFSTKSLGAYGNLQASFPLHQLDVEASYRYWGVQFESFNAAQQFNPQNMAQVRVGKGFWKRRLQINSGLKYTNFKTAGIASNLRSNTLFGSLNTTLRIKRLPVISLGYYPGSQLYWLEDKRLYEYYYYILNATVSHYFTAGGTPMQLMASYNRFSNRYSDSLVVAAQSFYSLFYTVWKGRFSFLANASRQQTEVNRLLTLEGGSSYAAKWFRIGASARWNQLPGQQRWGYSFSIGLLMGKWGTLNILTDRSFLPDRSGRFIPVQMGQIQYTKPLNFSIWR